MQITQGSLSSVFTGLQAKFLAALDAAENPDIERLMDSVPSTTGSENYPTGALLGDLEEVLDEVTITGIGAFVQNVANRTFARAIEVRRDDIADDNIGVYGVPVQQLARRAAAYPLRLASDVLLSGFSDTWIDDTTVYSATHEWVGGTAWSNLQTTALDADALDEAILALETRTGPGGEPLALSANLLICSPAVRSAAETLLELLQSAAGASNRQYKKADLLVMGRWGSSTRWLLMDIDPIRPLVLQDREGPEFTAQDNETDDAAFLREVYRYKARRRCAVAILAPWLIQASNGTT